MKRMLLCLLCLSFSYSFLSCARNEVRQNETLQEALQATKDIEENLPENIQVADAVMELTNLTLIPSVEPEFLRNVMPNSWHRLERLTGAEEQEFIRENINALLEVEETQRERIRWHGGVLDNYFSIYRQQVGIDIFYRIVMTEDNNPDFMSRAIRFAQFLIHQNTLLVSTTYKEMGATQFDWVVGFGSIEIISSGDNAKAILVTTVSISGVDRDNPYDWSRASPRRNGQLFGGTHSWYYFMDDLRNGVRSPIQISIGESHCLVDPDVPLRYSLQNAFDGDPSTAFVANNVEDELMSISIGHTISGIAIINNHEKAIPLQKGNSQIRRIETVIFYNEERRDVELATDIMSWQIIEGAVGWFSVNEVYPKGSSNNIFLTGLNVYSRIHGWLFGDMYTLNDSHS
ncbi:MAG: hypothetical protein FWC97_05555 [Treponema sp.]|nr:hypothetical protein [Treponema sp.]